MAKQIKRTLDLNTAARPTLEITLQDEAKTVVRVTTPTEGLMDELQQLSPEMLEIIQTGDKEGVEAVYTLTAQLLSCNLDGLSFTAEQLRDKYIEGFGSLVLVLNAYLDFVTELTKEKN